MIGVDASLLAFAANRGSPEHLRAAPVLESLVGGEAPWALPWSAAHQFVRLVTHPHAVACVLAPGDAWGFVDRLLQSRSIRLLGPTERHARVAAEVLAALTFPAGLPAGFETAVLLREHGVREVLSAERAMRRFTFLVVRDPVHGPPWVPGERPARRYRVLRAAR
jgi:hypothetical protein